MHYFIIITFYFHNFSPQSLPCIVTKQDALEGEYPEFSSGFVRLYTTPQSGL